MKGEFEFNVEHPGEMGAGIRPYADKVTISVESGDPGGFGTGEDSFQGFMEQALSEWFDGAKVTFAGPVEVILKGTEKEAASGTEYKVCHVCRCEYSSRWTSCPKCSPTAKRSQR